MSEPQVNRKLENLEKGRVKRYVGDEEKVRTTLSLSKSTREYLSQYGNGMSETIEYLVWVHSKGKAGLVTDKFEMLKDR
ncbi:hypothetical protein PL9214291365 [Planktothrix tepida PCC 9214]|uniref:Uncharacterized protein n=1 Tax=Planktothrix tepida PCC 9214 TaxID=671072 RepID=A0A1J1LIR8_9CYAN|nr:hypothetical protein PL9214291365 [Planktothrix tepida PCC 9214]